MASGKFSKCTFSLFCDATSLNEEESSMENFFLPQSCAPEVHFHLWNEIVLNDFKINFSDFAEGEEAIATESLPSDVTVEMRQSDQEKVFGDERHY